MFRFLLYMNALLTLLEESSKKCRIRDDTICYYRNLVNYIREYYSRFLLSEKTIQVSEALDAKLVRTASALKENFVKTYSWSTLDARFIYEEIKVNSVLCVCCILREACDQVTCVRRVTK